MKSPRVGSPAGCTKQTPVFMIVLSVALWLCVAPQAWSANNGEMDVDNNTTACPGASGAFEFDFPNFEVVQGSIVHINISPAFEICTSGNPTRLNDGCDGSGRRFL